jgi:hypothetical protein
MFLGVVPLFLPFHPRLGALEQVGTVHISPYAGETVFDQIGHFLLGKAVNFP